MNPRRQRFNESIVIGILSGGLVSTLSGAVHLNIIEEAGGIASVIFALFYALYVKYVEKQQTSFEQTWEENRESIVRFVLSTIDNDVIKMQQIFTKLESKGFDINQKHGKITLDDIGDIDYDSFKERLTTLPPLQNVLGFITYEQYIAVYDYLKYSSKFIEYFCNGDYQADLLKLRSEQAKKILELFNNEDKMYWGLKEWKNRLNINQNLTQGMNDL